MKKAKFHIHLSLQNVDQPPDAENSNRKPD